MNPKDDTKPDATSNPATERFAYLSPEHRKIVLESYTIRNRFHGQSQEWQDAFLKGLKNPDEFFERTKWSDQLGQALVGNLNANVLKDT